MRIFTVILFALLSFRLRTVYNHITPAGEDMRRMYDKLTLAYLAGAMDSDGHFSIKRQTYAMRVRGDANNPIFQERVGLKQVTPQIPTLLKETFGGHLSAQHPSTVNGKPLWGWEAGDRKATECAKALLPHLLVKRKQATLLLQLRETKDDDRLKHLGYWFEKEHPDWRKMPMLTTTEVLTRLGYADGTMVTQAVRNGALLSLPYRFDGKERPRVPAALVELLAEHQTRSKDGRGRNRPPQLIALRQDLWQQCRELNRIGTGDHPIYTRTGPYAPK